MQNVKFTFKDNFLLFIFGANYLLMYICVIKLKLNDNYKDMARYDLSKIMKRAWALFTNAHAKYPTFADALRKSIAEKCKAIEEEEKVREEKAREKREQAAISSVLFRAQIEADRIRREAEAKAERMKAEIAARKEGISYNEYQNRISRAMGYGCGSYCGD